MDCTVGCGYRNRKEQELAKRKGYTRADFGESPHNYLKSLRSMDLIPLKKFGTDRLE